MHALYNIQSYKTITQKKTERLYKTTQYIFYPLKTMDAGEENPASSGGSNSIPTPWYIQRVVGNQEIMKQELMLPDHETLDYVFNTLNNKLTNGTQMLKTLCVTVVDVTDEVSVEYLSYLKMVRKRDRSISFALGIKDLINARHITAGDEFAVTCDPSFTAFAFKLFNPSG